MSHLSEVRARVVAAAGLTALAVLAWLGTAWSSLIYSVHS